MGLRLRLRRRRKCRGRIEPAPDVGRDRALTPPRDFGGHIQMGSAFAAASGRRAGSLGARATGIFLVGRDVLVSRACVMVAIVGTRQKTADPGVPPIQMFSAKAKARRRAHDGQNQDDRDYSRGLCHIDAPLYKRFNDRQAFSIHGNVRSWKGDWGPNRRCGEGKRSRAEETRNHYTEYTDETDFTEFSRTSGSVESGEICVICVSRLFCGPHIRP